MSCETEKSFVWSVVTVCTHIPIRSVNVMQTYRGTSWRIFSNSKLDVIEYFNIRGISLNNDVPVGTVKSRYFSQYYYCCCSFRRQRSRRNQNDSKNNKKKTKKSIKFRKSNIYAFFFCTKYDIMIRAQNNYAHAVNLFVVCNVRTNGESYFYERISVPSRSLIAIVRRNRAVYL